MQVYWNLSDYENALKINLKVVILQKEVLGEKHPDYLEILSRLSATYTKMGKYNKALEISQEVVNSEREVLGEHNTTYLISLSNLASNYSKLGNHDKALDIFMQVVDSQREILGEKHPDYLFSLGHLAVQYRYIGDYTRALEISIKVVNVEREILGERHPDYLLSLSNLSLIYSSLGDWSKALEISQKLISEQKEILGERDLDYLFSLGNLASIYSDLGDYRAALKINKKLANLEKEIFGERHPRFLVSLNNLSLTYLKLHDYKAAMEILLKVIDLQKEILGYRHPDYLSSLNNLALAYSDLGNYSKALTINQKIGELEMEILGDHHPGYLVSLNNLASNYVDLCNYNMALEEIRKVVDLRKNVLGDSHPDYLVSLQNLSLIELYLSQGDSALFHYQKVLTKTKDRVIDYFALMTEFQREQFWRKNSFDFKIFPLFSENASVAHLDTIGFGFDTALFSKGLLLNATRDFDELFAEKGSPEAIAKFEELKQTKLQIQRILEKPIAERYLSVDSLEDIAQKKETELVKLSKEYGDYTRNMKINWKDVQSTLGNKDVAIEFVEYPTLTDTIKYAAFVVRKGWQYPRMISLFRKDQIQEFIKQDKDKIYANGYVGKQLKKLIWDPLEEAISEGDNVYFSASGVLHQLAIENLPANETQTLSEIFHLYRLSSTKEIVLKKAPEKNNSAVLYGGLQFDISNERMLAESKKYEKKENLYAMRGYQSDSTMRKGWGFLEGTLTEVQQINQLLKDKKYKTTFFTGESGNEESFKSLSGKKMGIIHIATHGFFETVADSKKNIFIQLRMGDQTLEKETVDPMIRSGLILSGGNRAWQGDTIPESIEDGVLTAKEICRMDLRGTDLVVLSACETGLGEVSSEGVFGLQRSFKQAGVQTLIMSLWGVNDQATNYMMTQFYTNLLSGKDKREAFLKAKKSCKEKFPEPQYWAAFIMLD
jgi:CHAT domain-containing protein/lipopolysaccharide biosynthesis regulator YciM